MPPPAYSEIKRLRSRGNCADAIGMLRTAPPASDEEAFEAAVCLFVCGDAASSANVCRTWRWKAQWAVAASQALAGMLQGGEASELLAQAGAAADDPAAPHDASAIYLLLLQANGKIEEAAAFIERRLQDPPAGETFLLTVMAEIGVAAGDWRLAYRRASAVLSVDPDDYRALLAQSTANLKVGNVHEALGNAIRASLLQQGAARPILEIMRCRNKLGDYYGCLAAFDKLGDKNAIAPEFHVELGTAYLGLENRSCAIAEFRAALDSGTPSMTAIRALARIFAVAGDTAALEALARAHPAETDGDVECVFLRGLESLQRGALDEAARRFHESMTLAERRGEAALGVPWPVPEPRIRHDYEQLDLLARRGRLDAAGRRALQLLKRYCGQARDLTATFAPEGTEAEALRDALCAVHYRPDPPFGDRALGENDYGAIEDKYLAERLVVIDNFLAPDALAALRRFCEEATVWKLHNPRGYMGALLAQGFSPGVLLAIADGLKRALPRVIGNDPMLQAWGFKYDQRMQGINLHADFAKVNVNFWITPDEACADPTTGGMVVYDLPAPRHWTFADYNSDSERLAAFLRIHGARPQRVPYRANRCVLFDSSLIHITDELRFRPGYENRRVNVTMLFGKARTVG